MKSTGSERRLSILFSGGLFLCVVLACGLPGKLLSKKTMFEGSTAKEAADAFKEKLGGPVKALSLELERDAATLRAQDPKKPENVDEYKYVKGIVLGPTPVQLNTLERNLSNTLFDLDEINLAATEMLAKTALERAAIEGGKVTKMMIERGLSLATDMTKSGVVRWDVTIEGPRESASATADAKGNFLGVDLSQTSRAANFSTYSSETLREAGPKIRQAFGGNVRIVELIIYEKYLWFKALPSSNEITQYKYDINGVTTSALSNIGDPTPINVRMSRRHKLEDFLINLDEIKLELAPELGKKALQRVNFTNGQVNLYKVSRGEKTFAREDLVTAWQVSCSQGRKRATVYYDLAGNEIKVIK